MHTRLRLREEAKSILTKTIRTLITQLTENDMTNQVWMTQLLSYLYKNTNRQQTIKNYFYHTPYVNLVLELEKVYNTRETEIKNRLQYNEHRSSNKYMLKKVRKSHEELSQEATDNRIYYMQKFLSDHLGNRPITDLSAWLSVPPWPLFLLLFVAIYVAYVMFSDMPSSINQILVLTTATTFFINGFFSLEVNAASIVFEMRTSLRTRFPHFELDHLPTVFKWGLEEELHKIFTINNAEKAPKKSKSLTAITSKPATHTASPVSPSIFTPIVNSEHKTAVQPSSVVALETKYDPQMELASSEGARRKRLGGYIPRQIFDYDFAKETVTLHFPDREQPFLYNVGYPNYSLFQLWTAR